MLHDKSNVIMIEILSLKEFETVDDTKIGE